MKIKTIVLAISVVSAIAAVHYLGQPNEIGRVVAANYKDTSVMIKTDRNQFFTLKSYQIQDQGSASQLVGQTVYKDINQRRYIFSLVTANNKSFSLQPAQ